MAENGRTAERVAEGAGQPGHREVLNLAVPMILSNLSVPLLGLVDTAVVGHLPGPEHLGAVAVGAVVFSFIFWGFGFLRMGTTGFVAQAWGGGDQRRVVLRVAQASLLAVVLAAILLLMQQPIESMAFLLMDPGPLVEPGARSYFSIRIWAAPATLGNFVLIGAFLGAQNARAPLAIMLTTNLTNVVLDLVFVIGFGWGVPGVALASVCGEYLGLAVGIAIAWRHGLLNWSGLRFAEVIDRQDLSGMLRVNADIMLRTFCLIFAFAFFTRQGAQQGETVLAANAVLMNFQHFMSYGLDGFAHAAEALVGRAKGARNSQHLAAAVRLTGFWSLGVSLCYALAYLLLGGWLIHLLTDIESVRTVALQFLPWLIVSPLISVWSFWLDGVFVGATLGREMRNAMVGSAFGVFLPVWYLTQSWGNHGLWLALMSFMAARGIFMAWLWFRSGSGSERH